MYKNRHHCGGTYICMQFQISTRSLSFRTLWYCRKAPYAAFIGQASLRVITTYTYNKLRGYPTIAHACFISSSLSTAKAACTPKRGGVRHSTRTVGRRFAVFHHRQHRKTAGKLDQARLRLGRQVTAPSANVVPPHLGLSVLGGDRSLLEAVLEAAGEGLHVPVDVANGTYAQTSTEQRAKQTKQVSTPAAAGEVQRAGLRSPPAMVSLHFDTPRQAIQQAP